MADRIDTKRGRDALKPRKAPYYAKIRRGLSLGLRKLGDERGTWTGRLYVGPGGNDFEWKVLGDLREKEGAPGLDYAEARRAIEAWTAEVESGVRSRDQGGRAIDVEWACRAYVKFRAGEHPQGARDADLAFRRFVYGYKFGPDRKRCEREYEAHEIAKIQLAKFREADLRDWRDGLVAAGMTKSTANRNLTHLKAALNRAVATRHAGAQLAGEIALVTAYEGAAGRREIFLDIDQRRALLAAAATIPCPPTAEPGGALRDLIEAAALTGARPGELVGLPRSAFDSRTKAVRFRGKAGERTVPLSPPALVLFARFAKSKLPAAPLLTRDDGKAWNASDWDEALRAAAKAAKLPAGTVLYSLRHSFITEALLGGMATLEVARLVGTSLAMIEKHYGHLVADRARESLAAVRML